jgi:peptidoglycan/xylan/chitin deacetylase (PgdA/CDA1 family)
MAKNQLNSHTSWRPKHGLRGVPVFLYHGITATNNQTTLAEGKKYWVTEDQFRDHLGVIHSQGYAVTKLNSVWQHGDRTNVGIRTTVITFDDGHASDYEVVFPLIQRFGHCAEFFINTATVNLPRFLSWSQIAEMHRAGMSIQSHGWDHVDLCSLPPRELYHQLRDSKWEMENRLGARVDVLSAPYGLLNSRVTRAAVEVGYRAICCSRNWPAQPGNCIINRVAVYSHTTAGQVGRLLRGNPGSYAARLARAAVLCIPKKLILSFRPELLTVHKSGVGA